jgi:hypothetical protein
MQRFSLISEDKPGHLQCGGSGVTLCAQLQLLLFRPRTEQLRIIRERIPLSTRREVAIPNLYRSSGYVDCGWNKKSFYVALAELASRFVENQLLLEHSGNILLVLAKNSDISDATWRDQYTENLRENMTRGEKLRENQTDR